MITPEYVEGVLRDVEVEDYHEILTPIQSIFTTFQECVDHHFETLDGMLLNGYEERDIELYPYGIVVFDTPTTALLIHYDQIRKQWYLGCLRFTSVDELLQEFENLRFGDIEFGDPCGNYSVRVPQNDPEIDLTITTRRMKGMTLGNGGITVRCSRCSLLG